MKPTQALVAAILLAVTATATGCATGGAHRPAGLAMSGPADGAGTRTSGSAGHAGDATADPTPSAAPAAAQVAAAFVAAWARPDLDPQTWVAGVTPYTTDELAAALASVDPHNVPAHRVTGAPAAVTATAESATFTVATDADTVQVACIRRDGRWLVADITPVRPAS